MSEHPHGRAVGDLVTLCSDKRESCAAVFRVCSLYEDEVAYGFLCDLATPVTREQIVLQTVLPEDLAPISADRVRVAEPQFPKIQTYYCALPPVAEERFQLKEGLIVTLRGVDALVDGNRESFEHYLLFRLDEGRGLCSLISPIGPCQRVLVDVPVTDVRYVPEYRALCQRARFPALVEDPYVDETTYVPEAYVRQLRGAGMPDASV
jgi:hypothetical protein